MADIDELVERVNKLSDDAVYIASRDWFEQVILHKPILVVPKNEQQEKAFACLLEQGFVYLDTERGQVGFRSTAEGRTASAICRAAIAPRDKTG